MIQEEPKEQIDLSTEEGIRRMREFLYNKVDIVWGPDLKPQEINTEDENNPYYEWDEPF
jgi:hypothetical protein